MKLRLSKRRATIALLALYILGIGGFGAYVYIKNASKAGNIPTTRGNVFTKPSVFLTPKPSKDYGIYYQGDSVSYTLNKAGAIRYEVRNYYGDIVEQNPIVGLNITINVKELGWYKLYLYGQNDQGGYYGTAVGSTTFNIFRKNPNFLTDLSGPSGSELPMDTPVRAATGIGPARLSINDLNNVDAEITRLDSDIAIEKKHYTPFDPVRGRPLMIAFRYGVGTDAASLAKVKKVVEHFKNDVQYWEGRNEPNFTMNGTSYATGEMKALYTTVKSVSPNLKVMGPGIVQINPYGLAWQEDFFKAGGGNYMDVYSFHAYNTLNGDFALARMNLDNLQIQLAKYGQDTKEKWQTEQGNYVTIGGAFTPRHQGGWEMFRKMILEQYGVPKEHDHYWYDRSHGFWEHSVWLQNGDKSLTALAPLARVWSEEVYGKKYNKAFDFGNPGNNLYLGNLYSGSDGSMAALMTTGATDGKLVIKSDQPALEVILPFGQSTQLTMINGQAVLSITELPAYVRIPKDKTIQINPLNWGANLARQTGVKISTNSSDTLPFNTALKSFPEKLINGVQDTWYYQQNDSAHPWMSNVATMPLTIDLTLPSVQKVGKAIIFAAPSWQQQGTILDYDLQYDDGGQWRTIQNVSEPTKTFKYFSSVEQSASKIDSYFSGRWVFTNEFPAVTTSKIRVKINKTTWQGGATQEMYNLSHQTGYGISSEQVALREIELYGDGAITVNPSQLVPTTSRPVTPSVPVSIPSPSPSPLPTPVASAGQPCLQVALNNRTTDQAFDSVKVQVRKSSDNSLVKEYTGNTENNGKIISTDSSLVQVLNNSTSYTVKITVPGYLSKTIPSVTNIFTTCHTLVGTQSLIAGDFNGDNKVSVLDIITAIRAYNGINDSSTSLALKVYGAKPKLSDLINLIRASNQ